MTDNPSQEARAREVLEATSHLEHCSVNFTHKDQLSKCTCARTVRAMLAFATPPAKPEDAEVRGLVMALEDAVEADTRAQDTANLSGEKLHEATEARLAARADLITRLAGAVSGEWRGIETFETEPHGQANPVLISCGKVVGEAWLRDPEGANDCWESGWWWAGTGPGEYAVSPVTDTNDAPTHWQPLPEAPTTPHMEDEA